MMLRVVVPLLIATVFLQGQQAVATPLIVIHQDRRVSTSAFVSAGGEFDQQQFFEVAPDTGPFDVSLFAQAALPDGDADASATQDSYLASNVLYAEGSVAGNAQTSGDEATAYGASQSNVAVRFTLANPISFELVGFVEGASTGVVTVQLSRPFQTVAWYSASNQRLDLDQSGTLEGDTYDLNVTCSAVGSVFPPGGTEQGSGSYEVRLLLGSPTDVPLVAGAEVGAYPNPFRKSTRLSFPDDVREVRIVDAQGRLVRTLAGSSTILFDGRDSWGQLLASGVYWAAPTGTADHKAIRLVRLR